MELNFNNDTVFFNITSEDFDAKVKAENTKNKKNITAILNQDLINFSIVEEFGKMTTGSLTLIDNDHIYSRLFRYGMKFTISWGYKKWNPELITPSNQKQAFLNAYRSGLQCVVINPKGTADDKGNISYTINFYSMEILQQKKYKVFSSGTKETVIKELFSDCGVDDPIIDFVQKDNKVNLTLTTNMRQYGTSFSTLTDLANDWHCIFRLGNDLTGKKVGFFIDSNKIGIDSIQANIRKKFSIVGDVKEFYYNSGTVSNINSYTWENHIGNSGQGVKLEIDKTTGQIIFRRYVAETQTIVDWTLNPSKIKDVLKKQNGHEASPQEIISMENQLLSATNFEQVKWAFDEHISKTAPDGIGYTINLKIKGDAFISPSLTVVFKNGFPDELQRTTADKLVTFIILKNTHTITKQGYFTDVEVVDSYTLNGSYLKNTVQLQQLG